MKRQNKVPSRDYILFYVNGRRQMVCGEKAFLSLSDYLRYEMRLTGTKVVCAEGDCGACSVLMGFPPLVAAETGSKAENGNGSESESKISFKVINSCISFVHLLDCCHVLTVESLKDGENIHPIQEAMVETHGTQCGFCTPGFTMAMAGMLENFKSKEGLITEKHVKNYLTGNLCRCTGYSGIVSAGMSLCQHPHWESLEERYHSPEIWQDLALHQRIPVTLADRKNDRYFESPLELSQACSWKKSFPEVRIVSSATDLGVQINKQRINPKKFLSLNLIPSLHEIREVPPLPSPSNCNNIGNDVWVGARVNLTQLENFMEERFPELARFLHVFASPQIKNIGTLIGNVANGSPIADTLPFLAVTNATVEVEGLAGKRRIPFTQFYKGYKVLDLAQDEIITGIRFALPHPSQETVKLYKVSKRKDLDISCVNAGFLLRLEQAVPVPGPGPGPQVQEIRIAYGGVGPTILRLSQTEKFLQGKDWSLDTIMKSYPIMRQEISPLSDVRGSSEYREQLVKNLLIKFYTETLSRQGHGHGHGQNRDIPNKSAGL